MTEIQEKFYRRLCETLGITPENSDITMVMGCAKTRINRLQFEHNRLCEAITADAREYIDDDHGPYRWKCKYCYKESVDDESDIPHDDDCDYVFARDRLSRVSDTGDQK